MKSNFLTQTRTGYLKIIVAAIIWGSLGIFVRHIPLSAPTAVFYRLLFSFIAVSLIISFRHRPEELKVKKSRALLICCGVGITINWVLFFYALKLTTIANAVFLTYTAPIFIALFASLILKERLERATFISIAISMAGIFLITSPVGTILKSKHLIGALCALGSAVTYGLLVTCSKIIMRNVSVLTLIFYENGIGVMLLFPFAAFDKLPLTSVTWLLLIILGVIHTTLAAFLYLNGLKQVKAQHAGVLAYVDPLSAVIFALIFLGELPTFLVMVGGLLIILAGLNIVIKSGKHQEQELT